MATHHVSGTQQADLPTCHPTRLHQAIHYLAQLPSCVTPSLGYYQIRSCASTTISLKRENSSFWTVSITDSPWARLYGYGNINPLSIDYACRPCLRTRLTLGGLTWPRNPWSFGGRVSHSSFATHACILPRMPSTTRSLCSFNGYTSLPYPSQKGMPRLRRCT